MPKRTYWTSQVRAISMLWCFVNGAGLHSQCHNVHVSCTALRRQDNPHQAWGLHHSECFGWSFRIKSPGWLDCETGATGLEVPEILTRWALLRIPLRQTSGVLADDAASAPVSKEPCKGAKPAKLVCSGLASRRHGQ